MAHHPEIIISPLLSEKSNSLKSQGVYVFKVALGANKIQIKREIERIFAVKPLSCATSVVKGKPKRLRNRSGYTSRWKKAIVTLKKGQSIAALEGV